jgi:hypothetical protein
VSSLKQGGVPYLGVLFKKSLDLENAGRQLRMRA